MSTEVKHYTAKEVEEMIRQAFLDKPQMDQKPLVIHDDQRRRLEAILARNFDNTDTLVAAVERMGKVDVGGVSVQLPLQLLERLNSRCLGMEFDKFIRETTRRLLEQFVNLR